MLPTPLLTRDQVTLLRADNVVSDAAIAERRTITGLGIQPQAVGRHPAVLSLALSGPPGNSPAGPRPESIGLDAAVDSLLPAGIEPRRRRPAGRRQLLHLGAHRRVRGRRRRRHAGADGPVRAGCGADPGARRRAARLQQRPHLASARAMSGMDIAEPFMAGSVVGAIVGAFIVVQLPDAVLKLVLGSFIILITWAKIPGIAGLGRAGMAVASACSRSPRCSSARRGRCCRRSSPSSCPNDRKALVATHGACMTVQHGLKILVFGAAGFAFRPWLPLIALMIVVRLPRHRLRHPLLEKVPERRLPALVPHRLDAAGARSPAPRAGRRGLADREQGDQAEDADDDPPPAEQREAVARDEVEEVRTTNSADDEGGDEADGDDRQVGGRRACRGSCRGRERRRRPWSAWRGRRRTPPPRACRRRAAGRRRSSRPSAIRRGSSPGTGRGRCRDRWPAGSP